MNSLSVNAAMSDKLKKQLILNLPYVLIGLYATKLGEAWRLAEGADVSQKFLHLMDGFTAAFQSPLPSFHPCSRHASPK